MKYALYLFLICVVISILYACKNKSAIPAQLDEGEVLFRTVQKSSLKTDTHFTLLIIKKNRIKTVYIHQRPHFATVRNLDSDMVSHIYLENHQRKVLLHKDTLPKKRLSMSTLTPISDTLFWDIPASRYKYTRQDTVFIFSVMKKNNISPLFLQDLPLLQGFVPDRFPAQIMLRTADKEVISHIIRMEEKDIADIEFEYP